MRTIEDSPPWDKNRQGFGVPQGGQPKRGEKNKQKKDLPKGGGTTASLCLTLLHTTFSYLGKPPAPQKKREEGKSRHNTERSLRKPPTPHQTERESLPLFLPLVVVPCLCLSSSGGSSYLSLSLSFMWWFLAPRSRF